MKDWETIEPGDERASFRLDTFKAMLSERCSLTLPELKLQIQEGGLNGWDYRYKIIFLVEEGTAERVKTTLRSIADEAGYNDVEFEKP